ncbi:DNA-binding MarR family transcriptional regulator [Murinocardiopsis flavida]|uniref:DNA-binding MarR family transcriptional regulator n=1 Tax=Murinocardiopsis flavida TaxID=645275 RepID=A0A2P8DNX8_9ACTN|nr:MarR family transcriptional regulator [Murinocardiopsis flavida]PSK98893.1 DNA-binding MarR family transcriptional regulator [Murinocardiopsis flavida]
MGDDLDWVLEQWRAERPDIDASPMGVVGRIQRASRMLERGLSDYFATHGLQLWEFDILGTLLRSGPPYELTAGALSRASMISSGAVTNRIDRLLGRGLIARAPDPANRRSILIRLTDSGRELANTALEGHVDNEVRLLASLGPDEQERLADLLRTLLTGLGDLPPEGR